MKNIHQIGKNIYITNLEEIKEADWCFYLNNLGGGNIVCQAYKHSEDKRMLFDNGKHNRKIGEGITPLMCECKKIILTTDQNLIADGIQAIDDEFLQWFVNNPSCEFIQTERLEDGQYFDYLDDNSVIEGIYENYKIIIPQEEFKQEPKNTCPKCRTTDFDDCHSIKCPMRKEEPQQETLEDELWGNVFAKIKQYGLNNEVLTILKQNFNISKR